jgi:Uma2 family endonuclease
MNPRSPVLAGPAVVYPESDGLPMADNTEQFYWIVLIKEGLEALFAGDPDVFVAGDLLWYPVEGQPKIRKAPDAMVVFGRPKGRRGSYVQHLEGGIGPQVVFEVLSPNNTQSEMRDKLDFYEHYGVEEYYLWDPDEKKLLAWLREADRLMPLFHTSGHVSPRLGVRFELRDGQLELYDPAGARFLSYVELKQLMEQERQRAEQERQRAEQERQRAEQAEQRAARAQEQAERLAEQLRQLGVDSDAAN